MTYLESVTQAYERGYKIGVVHGRAENIATEERLWGALIAIQTSDAMDPDSGTLVFHEGVYLSVEDFITKILNP